MTATQSTFTNMRGVARGDLVFVAGFRTHGYLVAKLVLFAAPTTRHPDPDRHPDGHRHPDGDPDGREADRDLDVIVHRDQELTCVSFP